MTTDAVQRVSAGPAVAPRIVELACLAPSVHNTQPWSWRVDGATVELYADLTRLLPAEDPVGRNLTISCGAALHHLQFAAHALGWDTDVQRLPASGDPALLARVTLHRGLHAVVAPHDLGILRQRCTDRRRFTAWPVPAPRLERLVGEASAWGARGSIIDDVGDRFRVELIANRALIYRDLDPAALDEQRHWIGRHDPDGIPLTVLPVEPDHLGRRSRFGAGVLEDTRLVINGGDGLIALGGDADDVASWVRTGEGLSALWLEATRMGLSVVPLSQPVEIDATRHELRDTVLHGAFLPHLLLRVGWQAIGRSDLPRTPRRPVADVLRD